MPLSWSLKTWTQLPAPVRFDESTCRLAPGLLCFGLVSWYDD